MPNKHGEGFLVDPLDLDVPILCYPFPEVRDKLRGLSLPLEFFLGTTTEPVARELLKEGGYSFYDDLHLPTRSRGEIDSEAIHVPILEQITEHNSSALLGLSEFFYQYPTHGSTEGIRGLIEGWSISGEMTRLVKIKGDYPGHEFEASMRGVEVHEVDSLSEAGDPVSGDVYLVSNPSAVDGNWHDTEEFENFIARGHAVILDFAYGGLTSEEHLIDVSAPNIKAITTSPSKTFGVFYQRYPGITYAREEVKPLVSNKPWFRAVPGLMDVLELCSFGLNELPCIHKDRQFLICGAVGRLVGECMDIRPSDNILMAHADESLPEWMPESIRYKCMAPRGRSTFRLSTLFARLEEYEVTQKDI